MSKWKATDNSYERKCTCLINMWQNIQLPINEKYQNNSDRYTSFCLWHFLNWNLKNDSWWCDCLDIIGGSVNPYNLFRSSLAVGIKRLNMFMSYDPASLIIGILYPKEK